VIAQLKLGKKMKCASYSVAEMLATHRRID